MNRNGELPSLTMIMIALGLFLAIATGMYSMYNQFGSDNSYTSYSDTYNATYSNISSTGNQLTTTSNNLYNTAQNASISQTVTIYLNTLTIGLGAIQYMLNIFPMISVVLEMFKVVPLASWFFGFIFMAITVIVAMKYIQAARGSIKEA